MDNFRKKIRTAISGYLKEKNCVNVTESLHDYIIFLRSMQGPPFKIIARIYVAESEINCFFNGERLTPSTSISIDLADPELFDHIENWVKSILD